MEALFHGRAVKTVLPPVTGRLPDRFLHEMAEGPKEAGGGELTRLKEVAPCGDGMVHWWEIDGQQKATRVRSGLLR